ncbi:3-hydroxyisobutyryl-CoA hydrolase-like protein 2, mitochondrial-like [Dorcoceras hygrometricum]|uniref:3-hydroxyisobutyryl-CoA hydrolase-like protein 2, mitochondrial-like n=1 Tax=Dorcoceras hygrometricum TaxID=472368 RepID=A0A2Z7D2D1_9LAMI|nr:3-hydroxyisobutyryl-CoA hydrolase-like protein 2, mitochondrial-like [Dorcoceras hygrometricum]
MATIVLKDPSNSSDTTVGEGPSLGRHARPARMAVRAIMRAPRQYGPFNPYIPIRSTTIGKSRVTKDPIAMHTSWRSNSDITSVTSQLLIRRSPIVSRCFSNLVGARRLDASKPPAAAVCGGPHIRVRLGALCRAMACAIAVHGRTITSLVPRAGRVIDTCWPANDRALVA